MKSRHARRVGPNIETLDKALASADAQTFAQARITDNTSEGRGQRVYVPWRRQQAGFLRLDYLGMRPNRCRHNRKPVRESLEHRHRQPFGVRGQNQDVRIRAQPAGCGLIDPAGEGYPVGEAKGGSAGPKFIDRAAAGESRAP